MIGSFVGGGAYKKVYTLFVIRKIKDINK